MQGVSRESISTILAWGPEDEDLAIAAYRPIAAGAHQEPMPSIFDFPGVDLPTPDWTARVGGNWQQWWSQNTSNSHHVLEIGSYEGRSAFVWANHMVPVATSLTLVDLGPFGHFPGFEGRCALLERNIRPTDSLTYGASALVLPFLAAERLEASAPDFGFVYIDGSHHADDVVLDLCYAYRMLAHGGVIVCDDYDYSMQDLLDSHEARSAAAPRRGIHAFMALYGSELEVLPPLQATTQIAFRKVGPRVELLATISYPLAGASPVNPPLLAGDRVVSFPAPVAVSRPRRQDAVTWIASGRAAEDLRAMATEPTLNAIYTGGILTTMGGNAAAVRLANAHDHLRAMSAAVAQTFPGSSNVMGGVAAVLGLGAAGFRALGWLGARVANSVG